jgi:ABC-type lipoprotein release transport system permease subunit
MIMVKINNKYIKKAKRKKFIKKIIIIILLLIGVGSIYLYRYI